MAIKGLTDRPAAPPQLGTLRKGAPKPQNGNKPGADLTYFRFDSDDQGAVARFREIYGDEPNSIRVFVPFATTEDNFDAWREEWSASSLKHRCNGETVVRWLTDRGTYSDEPKPCPGGCKQVGRLKVIIPELKRFAIVTVLTTSVHDILQVHANLLALESVRGSLAGIPLILRRAPREISTPAENGKRARREKWLITIEAAPSWVELQLAALERASLPEGEQLALPEWDGEDEEIEEACDYAPVQAPAPVQSAPAVEHVSLATLHAIQTLWSKYGVKIEGQSVSFGTYLKQKKGIADPSELPREDGEKMLTWLQQKALAAEAPALAEEPESEPPQTGDPRRGAGLDQWRCTQETRSRQLAMDTLNLTKRLESSGVTEEQWRLELNEIFRDYPRPVSRKSLTAEELRETWLPLVEGWAKRNEAKKGAAAL